MKNKIKEAHAYLRYSSHNQDDGWSIESQKSALEKYAKANNIRIIKYFIDEAKTGRNTQRQGYQNLMTELNKGKVKILLIHKMDRMHRDAENQLHDIKRLNKLGIRLIATADGIDTQEPSTNLIATIKAAIAEQYSINLSAETRKGLTEAAKSCLHCGGKPPFGFKLDENKRLEIDETTAPAIREIFKMYLADMGYTAIINWLKDNGYKTAKGNDFSKSAINSILKNEKYSGVYTYDKSSSKDENGRRNSHKYKDSYIKIKGGCPAIVTPEEFKAVQDKMKQKSCRANYNHSKHYYPLNGFIWNNDKSARFSGNVNHSNGNRYFQYRCSESGNKSLNADNLEEAVFFALREILISDDKLDVLVDTLNRYVSEIHKELSNDCRVLNNKKLALENRRENLLNALESGRTNKSRLNRLESLEAEISDITERISLTEVEPHTFTKDNLKILKKQFIPYMKTVQTLHSKNLIDSTIEQITVDNENIEISFKNSISVNEKIAEYFK